MKYSKRFFLACIILGSVVSVQLPAKVRVITSQRDFEREVAAKGICVALFYDATDTKNGDIKDKNKRLQHMFEDVSAKTAYDDANLAFIKINAARKEFAMIMNQYAIDELPTVILFRDGRLVTEQGNACILNGFIARETLESFIDNYCGAEIKKLDSAKDRRREQSVQEDKTEWYPYFYPRDIFVRDYDPSKRLME